MATAKHVNAQTDFAAGEVDDTLKRDDDIAQFKTGLRQCQNYRITDTHKLTNRLGRSIRFIDGVRVDEVLMSPGNIFYLVFSAGRLAVRNAAGTVVFTTALKGDGVTAIPWTTASVTKIVWDVYQLSIYIAYADGFPVNVPQVLTWDGVSQTSTWTLTTFAESIIGNQKRTLFYRLSPLGITMQPAAQSGSGVAVTFSAGMNLVAGHVGTRMRFVNRQILITAVGSSTTATVTIEEPLPGSQVLTFTVDPTNTYNLSDVVIGSVTGSQGIVTAINAGAKTITVQLLTTSTSASRIAGYTLAFSATAADSVVGPSGALTLNAGSVIGVPQPVTIWDDEVINVFRGYPSSLFVDQGRLGLCNFGVLPAGLAWSAIGNFTDLYVTGLAAGAIFQFAPNKSQVLYVAAGMQSSEFVFCDNAVYEIPINQTTPLSGATVAAFNKITDDGCAAVQPRRMQNVIIYVNAGGKSVRAIMTTGAYYRANESRDISEFHNHLLNAPVAIACPTANDPNFPERYFYVLNGDGTLAVGKVDVQDGQIRTGTLPGWIKEFGGGTVLWVSARAGNVMFTTTYQPGGAAAVTLAEQRDFTQYLDAAVFYNAMPAIIDAGKPGGKGPLWWIPNGTVTVLDLGTRQMGIYAIDANGFLVPQFSGGENLASVQLVVGQAWTATVEPFVPAVPAGQDFDQRMTERSILRVACYFSNSTGFLWQGLFGGKLRPGGPALGAVVRSERVPTYKQHDDATKPPPLREEVEIWRPGGRDFDPRVTIVKDTAGPLNILEIAMEITV